MNNKQKDSLFSTDDLNNPSMIRGGVTGGILASLTSLPSLAKSKSLYAKNIALAALANGPAEAIYQKIRNIKGSPEKRNIQSGAEIGALSSAAMTAVQGKKALEGSLIHHLLGQRVDIPDTPKGRALAILFNGALGGLGGGAFGAVEGKLESTLFSKAKKNKK